MVLILQYFYFRFCRGSLKSVFVFFYDEFEINFLKDASEYCQHLFEYLSEYI